MSIKVCNIRLDKAYLESDQNKMNNFLDSVTVKLTTSNFVTTRTVDYWSVLIFYEPNALKQTPTIENKLTVTQEEMYHSLKVWRNNKASELDLPQYMICYNSELIAITIRKPKTITDLRKIKGFGETKTAKYGKDILAVLTG